MSSYRIGRRTPKLGHLLRLTILDHCKVSGSYAKGDALTFVVAGILVRETPTSYILSNWLNPQNADDDNAEWVVIIKSVVLQGYGYPPPK